MLVFACFCMKSPKTIRDWEKVISFALSLSDLLLRSLGCGVCMRPFPGAWPWGLVILVFFWCSFGVLLWGCQDQHGCYTISQRSDAAGPGHRWHRWTMNSLPQVLQVLQVPEVLQVQGLILGQEKKRRKRADTRRVLGLAWLVKIGKEDEGWRSMIESVTTAYSRQRPRGFGIHSNPMPRHRILLVAFLCFLWIVGMAVGSWGWCKAKSHNI